jgi:hypothetical protein
MTRRAVVLNLPEAKFQLGNEEHLCWNPTVAAARITGLMNKLQVPICVLAPLGKGNDVIEGALSFADNPMAESALAASSFFDALPVDPLGVCVVQASTAKVLTSLPPKTRFNWMCRLPPQGRLASSLGVPLLICLHIGSIAISVLAFIGGSRLAAALLVPSLRVSPLSLFQDVAFFGGKQPSLIRPPGQDRITIALIGLASPLSDTGSVGCFIGALVLFALFGVFIRHV